MNIKYSLENKKYFEENGLAYDDITIYLEDELFYTGSLNSFFTFSLLGESRFDFPYCHGSTNEIILWSIDNKLFYTTTTILNEMLNSIFKSSFDYSINVNSLSNNEIKSWIFENIFQLAHEKTQLSSYIEENIVMDNQELLVEVAHILNSKWKFLIVTGEHYEYYKIYFLNGLEF